MIVTISREPTSHVRLISVSIHGQKVERNLPVIVSVNLDPVETGELNALTLLVELIANVHVEAGIFVCIPDTIFWNGEVNNISDVDLDCHRSTSTATIAGVLRGEVDGLGNTAQSKNCNQNGLHCNDIVKMEIWAMY
jgi:hypothetical protein